MWSSSVVAQQNWATYTNPRFGTTADYPADLFTVQDPPAENGNGQTFRTADGRAELSIYETNNLEAERPQAYVTRHVNLDDVTFKRVTSDFYVVSGTRGGTIFYERCVFPNNDVLNCFYISYPASEKAAWDAIVTRISKSLRFAATNEGGQTKGFPPSNQPESAPPTQAGESCDFTGVWRDDLGSSLSITQSGDAINGNALFSDIGGDVSFSGNLAAGKMIANYSSCPGNSSAHLQSGGKITLISLSGCNDLSGVLDDSAGGRLFDFSLKRSSVPPGGSSCAGGSPLPGGDVPSP